MCGNALVLWCAPSAAHRCTAANGQTPFGGLEAGKHQTNGKHRGREPAEPMLPCVSSARLDGCVEAPGLTLRRFGQEGTSGMRLMRSTPLSMLGRCTDG